MDHIYPYNPDLSILKKLFGTEWIDSHTCFLYSFLTHPIISSFWVSNVCGQWQIILKIEVKLWDICYRGSYSVLGKLLVANDGVIQRQYLMNKLWSNKFVLCTIKDPTLQSLTEEQQRFNYLQVVATTTQPATMPQRMC